MEIKDFLRMFAYDDWANRQCLAAMRAAPSIPQDALARMAHILSAQKLWLERLLNQPQSLPVWPVSTIAVFTIDDCVALADEMSASWLNYLERLGNRFTPGSLAGKIEYRNSKGEPWSSRVEDVLTHVLFHSVYHRGQIAFIMRASGQQPAYTDFIHAIRQGYIEEGHIE
jgi:uncharacterized damage-inducible protein DinB